MATPLKIAIVGSGNVGGALAALFSAAGHSVTVGLRAGGTRRPTLPATVKTAPILDAVAGAEVVVFSVPWPAAKDAVTSAGPLAGKVVIDTNNPVLPDLSGLSVGTTTSAAEQIAGWAPGAKVVKAFNTIGAGLLGHGEIKGQRAGGFLCGDDAAAKATVARLVSDAGLDPTDVGPLAMARALEPMALLWVDMVVKQKAAMPMAFKLLR